MDVGPRGHGPPGRPDDLAGVGAARRRARGGVAPRPGGVGVAVPAAGRERLGRGPAARRAPRRRVGVTLGGPGPGVAAGHHDRPTGVGVLDRRRRARARRVPGHARGRRAAVPGPGPPGRRLAGVDVGALQGRLRRPGPPERAGRRAARHRRRGPRARDADLLGVALPAAGRERDRRRARARRRQPPRLGVTLGPADARLAPRGVGRPRHPRVHPPRRRRGGARLPAPLLRRRGPPDPRGPLPRGRRVVPLDVGRGPRDPRAIRGGRHAHRRAAKRRRRARRARPAGRRRGALPAAGRERVRTS